MILPGTHTSMAGSFLISLCCEEANDEDDNNDDDDRGTFLMLIQWVQTDSILIS